MQYNKDVSCRQTIAVADLRRGLWLRDTEFVKLPTEIEPFGAAPGVVLVIDPHEKKQKIVIINGNTYKVRVFLSVSEAGVKLITPCIRAKRRLERRTCSILTTETSTRSNLRVTHCRIRIWTSSSSKELHPSLRTQTLSSCLRGTGDA